MKLITKSVYSFYYPEVRKIVDELWQERPHKLYEGNYTGAQDFAHEPLLTAWREWLRAAGIGLHASAWPEAYPLHGASEGIRVMVTHIAAQPGASPRVHLFKGDYEGFRQEAQMAGLVVVDHFRTSYQQTLVTAQPGDWLFLSYPSSIDGNVWSEFETFLEWVQIHSRKLNIVLDLTYVGCVPNTLDLTASLIRNQNVKVILTSLSKPFGVYYHRIGALWSRFPIPGLFGNRWCKNLFSLELGRRLLTTFGPQELPKRYRLIQEAAIELVCASGEVSDDIKPVDVVLLAEASEPKAWNRAFSEQGVKARICLTPTIAKILKKPEFGGRE